MIEDQIAPKRCGHTKGKLVVERAEALDRIQAAVDARNEGDDILILARTDARHGHGLDEAITRAQAFRDIGADIIFVEAPKDESEMRTICAEIDAPCMANMVEGGETPILPPAQLEDIGFRVAAYPLTLMSAAMKAMLDALEGLKSGQHPNGLLLDFADLRDRVGFNAYYEAEQRYAASARD
jgi:2-methylisocitrate lyase-like PEP mutase family enzyme